MNILDEIIAYKKQEVRENKELYPVKLLEKSVYFTSSPVSLQKYVCRKDISGIIAEFKRQSPSRGIINEFADPATVCLDYMQAGAAALSVITDSKYFGGSNKDLKTARRYNYCPILRKDFIVSDYQIIEARSIGADAILLIAEVLTSQELKQLYKTATDLQMEVLFEIHEESSLDKLPGEAKIIGINNRNLKTFQVSIEHSLKLADKIPAQVTKIAESGIDNPAALIQLSKAGFDGFLMGERFMREANPGKACKLFIEQIRKELIVDNSENQS